MQFSDLRQRLDDLVKQSPFSGLSSDVQLLLQSQLNSLINSANLVSREEFEIQAEMLLHAQDKLADLEQRLSQLEASSHPQL